MYRIVKSQANAVIDNNSGNDYITTFSVKQKAKCQPNVSAKNLLKQKEQTFMDVGGLEDETLVVIARQSHRKSANT